MESSDREQKYEVFGIDRMVFDADAAAYLPVDRIGQSIDAKKLNLLICCYDDDGLRLNGIQRLNAKSNCVQVYSHRVWMRLRRWSFEPETEEDDAFLRSVIPENWHHKIRSVGPRDEVDSYFPTPPYICMETAPTWMHGITFFDAEGENLTARFLQEVDFRHSFVTDRYGVEHPFDSWKIYVHKLPTSRVSADVFTLTSATE